MKKMTYILTIIISVFSFLHLFNEVSTLQYNRVASFESSLANELDKEYVFFEFQIVYQNGNSSFDELINFVEKNNLTMIITNTSSRYDQIIDTDFYLYTKVPLNDFSFFKALEGFPIDFTSNNGDYYSSHDTDKNKVDSIDFINNNYHKDYQSKISIKQAKTFLIDQSNAKQVNVFLYAKNKEVISSKIAADNTINNYILDDIIGDVELVKLEDVDFEHIQIMILLSVASLIIICFCNVIQLKREITIRKLFGNSNHVIFARILLPTYIKNLFLYVASQILMFIFVISNVTPIKYIFINELISVFCLYLIFILLGLTINYFALCKIGRVVNIKKTSDTGIANIVTMCLKVCLITIMLTPFIAVFQNTSNNIQDYYTLINRKKYMTHNMGVYGFDLLKTEKNYDEVLSYFTQKMNSVDFIYQDFSFEAYIRMTQENLHEEGNNDNLISTSYIIANTTYLQDYKIYDTKNKEVNFNKIAHNTLLVPLEYKNKKIDEIYCQGKCDEIIYVKDGTTFYNNFPLVPDRSFVKKDNPIILVKVQFDETMNWSSSYLLFKDTKETEKMVKDLKSKEDYKNVFQLEGVNPIYNTSLLKARDGLISMVLMIVLYVLMILIFQYEVVFVYFEENKQELSIYYLMGKNYLQSYFVLLFGNMFSYFIPLTVGVSILGKTISETVPFVVVGGLVELLISIIMIRYFERKKLVSTLKGE